MKKLFISQPMADKTDKEILAARNRAIRIAKELLDDEIEVINSFIESAPEDAKPLWYLGESLKFLSEADVAYFVEDWENYRGCRIEYICAQEYGIDIIKDGIED